MSELYSAMLVFRLGTTKEQVQKILDTLDPALEFPPKRGVIVNPGGVVQVEFKGNYILDHPLGIGE
jgi:hypothetical protein